MIIVLWWVGGRLSLAFSSHKLQIMNYLVGADITCYYRGTRIKGTIVIDEPKHIVVLLKTPYQGKSEFWDIGEPKVLTKKLFNSLK